MHRLLSRCFITWGTLTLLAFATLGSVTAHAQTAPTGTVHSTVLTWTPPAPVGGSGTLKGYNVYKSVSGANFIKINTAIVTVANLTDANVVSGQVAAYCATTLDSNSNESACSIQVSATTPANPNPPTALVASAQ